MKVFKGLTFASGADKASQFLVPSKTKLTCGKYKALLTMFGYTLAIKIA